MEGGVSEVVVVVKGGGGSPGCLPCVYLGRVAPLQDPAPVRCWNRPRPYCCPPQLGAEHTTATEQGSCSHPTELNGRTVEHGLIDLPWRGLLTNTGAHVEVAAV